MSLDGVSKAMASRLPRFLRFFRCRKVVCLDTYDKICELVSMRELAACLGPIATLFAWNIISREEADRYTQYCREYATIVYRRCMDTYRTCCGSAVHTAR